MIRAALIIPIRYSQTSETQRAKQRRAEAMARPGSKYDFACNQNTPTSVYVQKYLYETDKYTRTSNDRDAWRTSSSSMKC